MNGTDFLGGPAAQALGWALLHLLWQGALVAGLLAATLSLLSRHRANVRYAASCAALALLLTLGVITAWRVYEPAPVRTAASTSAAAEAAVPELDTWATPKQATWKDRVTAATMTARAWLPQIVLLWLVGVVVLSSRLVVSWLRANRLARRGATPATAQWQRALVRLARTLHVRRAVTLLESAAVEVPTVVGWMRPVILIPAATLTGLSPEQIEMILAHELAHIRRHDFFVNLLQAVVETLMFYHPAVWWMSRQVRVERENCCDDLAVAVCGNALQYARALTRLEELRSEPVQVALAANGGSLIERVRRLVGARPDAAAGAPRYAAGLVLMTVLALLLAGPSLPLLAQRDDAPAATSSPSAAVITVDVDAPAPADAADDGDAVETIDLETGADHDYDTDAETDGDFEIATAPPALPSVPEWPAGAPLPPAAPSPRAMVAPPAVPAAPGLILAPLSIDASGLPNLTHLVHNVTPAALESARVGLMAANDANERVRERISRSDSGAGDDERSSRKLSEGKLTVDELISLRVHGITPEYIEEMRKTFGDLSLHDLTSMKIHGVDAKYANDMRALLGEKLAVRDLVGMRSQNLTPAWINQMRSTFGNVSLRDLMSLRVHGVDAKYIGEMRELFGRQLSAHDIVGLRVQNLTPAYVARMRKTFGELSLRDLMSMKVQNVDAEYIQEMRALLGAQLSAKDIVGLRVQNLTRGYVDQMRGAGLGTLTTRDLISLKVQDVDAAYIRELRDAGVEITSAKTAASLKVLGITPSFVRDLKAAGYGNLTARELTRLATSGVNADFIRDMQQYRTKR